MTDSRSQPPGHAAELLRTIRENRNRLPTLTTLDVQTAISQWLYGRMMDEDPCQSLLRISRASADLWSWLTVPDYQPNRSMWHHQLYMDAWAIFGHHFPAMPAVMPMGNPGIKP